MAELYRCAACGNVLSDTLGGHCPGCLLKEGLAESSVGPPGLETAAYQSRRAENAVLQTAGLPSPGQEFGAYHIVRALGHGGMGSVFEAEELDSGRRLALKVLNHSLDSPGARQRFLREGRLAASVNHPQSVYVFGTEEIQGAPVIIMELVQGGTLQDRVRGQGPLPIQEAVDAILQIVDGLEAAHAVGVLHRDIKPANCFVDGEGPHLDKLKEREGLDSLKSTLFLPLMFTMNLAMYIAFPSVLCALVFRGGLLWWLFGLTAVTKNGQVAGRWRLCGRNLMAWSPLIIFPIALAMLAPLEPDAGDMLAPLVNELAVPGVFLAIAYAVLVMASTFTNQRGWPDRLAGTWLVIR